MDLVFIWRISGFYDYPLDICHYYWNIYCTYLKFDWATSVSYIQRYDYLSVYNVTTGLIKKKTIIIKKITITLNEK